MNKKGFTIFLTGLSGAGKSTIAELLFEKIQKEYNRVVTLLDGDVVREHLSKGLGFSKEDRNANIERIGFVASEITKHGGIVICSAIAPYKEPRSKNRELISKHGDYIEVFVSTPIEVCEERDVKGLYKKARSGELKGFTGIDDPYEIPEGHEIDLNTKDQREDESVSLIVEYLTKNKLL